MAILLSRARRRFRSTRSALRSDVVDRSRDCRGSAQSAIGRLTAEALKAASLEGARLRGLELGTAKDGKTVITATSFFRAYKAHRTAPSDGTNDDRISRAIIAIDTGEVFLHDNLWLGRTSELHDEEIRGDVTMMVGYLSSFANSLAMPKARSGPTGR